MGIILSFSTPRRECIFDERWTGEHGKGPVVHSPGGAPELCPHGPRGAGYGWELFGYLGLYAAALVLSAGYSVWYIRYHVQFFAIMDFEESTRRILHAKSGRMSNEVLETPDAYAFIRQADGARQNLFRFGQIYVEAVMTLLEAAMVAAYVRRFHGMFLLLLPLSFLPTLMEMLYGARLWNRGYETVTQCQREEAELEKAIVDEAACKESRASGAGARAGQSGTVLRTENQKRCCTSSSLSALPNVPGT